MLWNVLKTIFKIKLFLRKLKKHLSTFEIVNILTHSYLSLKNIVYIVVLEQILLKYSIFLL